MFIRSFSIARLSLRNIKRLGFGGGSSTTTQKSDPWSGQQGYLTDVMQQAQNQYNNYTPQTYTQATGQSTVADMNPIETGAIQGLYGTGMNGTSATNAANSALTNTLNADPTSNPYMSSMIQNTLASTVPGLEKQFAQGNNMNNPGASYAVSQGANSAVGNLLFNQYNQNIANQNSAAGTASGLYGAQIGGQQAALGAGQTQQQQAQNVLDNLVNSFNFQQQLPYNKINQYSNLVNGQYGGTTTTSQPMQSLFSDRRLKKDIKHIGYMANGLKKYEFKYIWADKIETGVMADEVENFMPEAIGEIMGFQTVNYAMVGE